MPHRKLFLLIAGVFFISCCLCFAMVSMRVGGHWPDSWPKELEPFRKKAMTFDIMTGTQENAYEIHFEKREEFENLWPTILKLKDKGAPLTLLKIEKPFKKGKLFNNEKPVVRIFSYCYPAQPRYRPGGKELIPAPPWPDSIKSPTGQLPEYVTISQDGNSLIPVEDKKLKVIKYRARTEIELVVDGNIIDLNRIPLPADTPIIDKRFEEK